MDKKLKLFVACCAIALTAICSTTKIEASASSSASNDNTTLTNGGTKTGGGCVGKGTCGITPKGVILVGKWMEW